MILYSVSTKVSASRKRRWDNSITLQNSINYKSAVGINENKVTGNRRDQTRHLDKAARTKEGLKLPPLPLPVPRRNTPFRALEVQTFFRGAC